MNEQSPTEAARTREASDVNSSCHFVNHGLQLAASITVLSVMGCHQDRHAPSTPSTLTRDSAGIEIIENPRPAHGSRLGWVAPEPSHTIGTREGDAPYLLFRVRDAMRLPDGRFVVADQGSNELRIFDASAIHTATEGDHSAALGVFPGRQYYSASMLGTEVTMLLPFSPSIAAASWGGLVVVAPNHGYEIRAFGSDGTLRRIVRRDHTPVQPTPAYREAFFREFLRERGFSPEVASSEEEALEQVRQTMGEVPLPEALPAFATVLTDAIDHLWVSEFTILDGEFEIPGQETSAGPVWTVFDPHGHVLGFVETPPGLLIHEIGADYLLGHETDEDGIEYVRLWPLSRARPDR